MELGNKEFKNKVLLRGKLVDRRIENIVIKGEDYSILYIEVPRKECEKVDSIRLIVKAVTQEMLGLLGKEDVLVTGRVSAYNVNYGVYSTFLCVKVESMEDATGFPALESNNIVKFEGRTSKTPKIRVTPKGKTLAEIIVKTDDTDGEPMYIFTVTWGKLARISSFIDKTDILSVWGRLESREYSKVLEDGTTETRVTYEVSANCIKNYIS